MEDLATDEGAHWYAVYTKAKEEARADYNLRGWNVETFSPQITKKQRNQFTGRVTYLVRPLFSRYIFARFDAERLLHKVTYTRGVHSVVSSDLRALPVADEAIASIKLQVGKDGFVKLEEDIQPGCRVVIKGGPFKGLGGIFEQSTKDADRVVILLRSINYQAKVTVEKDFVQRELPEGKADGAPRVTPVSTDDGRHGASPR
jgi:transcription antitermination factor NusG